MPHYIDNPELPNTKIDIFKYQLQHPNKEMPPIMIDGYLSRDVWSLHEALLLLAGYDPITRWDEVNGSLSQIPPASIYYIDGLSSEQLHFEGNIVHPRRDINFSDFCLLRSYANHLSLDLLRSPQDWIDWAIGKGFRPYWKEKWKPRPVKRHVSKSSQQDDFLLHAIRDLGHDPENLPRQRAGSLGVKSKVKKYCLNRPELMTESSFEHAWKRFRKRKKN